MVVLALLLIAAALAFGTGVLLGADRATTLDLFGVQVLASENGLFLLGAATMLVLLVGLWLLRAALRRARRRRAEVKELRRIAAQAAPTSHVSPAPGRAVDREDTTQTTELPVTPAPGTGTGPVRLGKNQTGRDPGGRGTPGGPFTGREGDRTS